MRISLRMKNENCLLWRSVRRKCFLRSYEFSFIFEKAGLRVLRGDLISLETFATFFRQPWSFSFVCRRIKKRFSVINDDLSVNISMDSHNANPHNPLLIVCYQLERFSKNFHRFPSCVSAPIESDNERELRIGHTNHHHQLKMIFFRSRLWCRRGKKVETRALSEYSSVLSGHRCERCAILSARKREEEIKVDILRTFKDFFRRNLDETIFKQVVEVSSGEIEIKFSAWSRVVADKRFSYHDSCEIFKDISAKESFKVIVDDESVRLTDK